jgi:TetR/AcrR family transcriptional regulator
MASSTSPTRPNQEPRWRRLPEERPRQILSAALEVFGEHGLAAARLEDIAKRAGLSKGTIYLYFPNKEELFREMVRDTVVSQIERGEEAIHSMTGSAEDALIQLMRAKWTFIRSPQFAPLFRLIHAEIHSFPDLTRFYAEEVVARGQRLIAGIIERGIASGEFREVEPLTAARMLNAPFVIHGLWCTHREAFESVARKTDDQIFDEMIDFYLHAIRSSDSSPAASRST